MKLDHSIAGRLGVVLDGDRLADYVYEPTEPQLESPRPFLLLRNRDGVEASGYRPADHVWHKGLSLALPNVGDDNFWGGPTYVRDGGYVQLPNNGAQVHRAFADESEGDIARLVETLDWITEQGATILTEARTLTARTLGADAWTLTWESDLLNASDASLAFGSPTSRGRENAGYAGLFWRGPVRFTGGEIVSAAGAVGDAARGSTFDWLAYLAPSGEGQSSVGVLMVDAAPGAPHPWFARSAEFAGLCPAPFFYDETVVEPEGRLRLAAVLAIGDGNVTTHAPAVTALARTLTLESDPSR